MIAGITSNAEATPPSLEADVSAWDANFFGDPYEIYLASGPTVSVVNGHGAYTFVWTRTAGSTRISVDDPYSDQLMVEINSGNFTYLSATFTCTVNGTGLVDETIAVTYTATIERP